MDELDQELQESVAGATALPLPARVSTGAARGSRDLHFHDARCRALNVLVALLGLALALPLMLLIAILIKVTSRGPVLYTQPRVGLDRRRRRRSWGGRDRRGDDQGGRVFTIYKFRTMAHRPHDATQVWAANDDPRVTPVGAVLRKFRLDELPQLVNVLMGDMNVVGPRPEQPALFKEIRHQVPEYPERQRVLPGITGWAQVNHPYDTCIDDVRRKVTLDLEYLDRRSPAEDLRILARTVPVMLLRKGSR